MQTSVCQLSIIQPLDQWHPEFPDDLGMCDGVTILLHRMPGLKCPTGFSPYAWNVLRGLCASKRTPIELTLAEVVAGCMNREYLAFTNNGVSIFIEDASIELVPHSGYLPTLPEPIYFFVSRLLNLMPLFGSSPIELVRCATTGHKAMILKNDQGLTALLLSLW